MQRFMGLDGRFTLSDDSHGVEQVGLNFPRVLDAIRMAGIKEIVCLATIGTSDSKAIDERFQRVCWKTIALDQLESHGFWKVQ